MNEEIKTTAAFLDEALTGNDTSTITATDDIDVSLYTPDDVVTEELVESDVAGEEDDILRIDLMSGASLTMKYDDMDWGKIWSDNYADMFNNVMAIMAMKRDMLRKSGEERTAVADRIIECIKTGFKEIGVPELDYSAYTFETKVEEADLYLEDYIRLIPEIMHTAQVDVLMKPTEGMSLEDIINKMAIGLPDEEDETV